MKHLTIRHFGPIEEADIMLRRVNLIIGPQSSGKSTVLKIACFCDWMERQIEVTQDPDRYCNAEAFVNNLVNFHKLTGYMKADSFIGYENDAVSFAFSAKENRCDFAWVEAMRWDYRRTKIAYIPSERNLVAAIPNWYQVSMNNDNILDFMKEWEFARKTFSKGERILDLPAEYKYNANSQTDRIVLNDGKELDLTVASSGLQSLTPLYIMLRYLTSSYYNTTRNSVEQAVIREHLTEVLSKERPDKGAMVQQCIVDFMLTAYCTDLFIEEPEAHIFPSTQKSFVYQLVGMLNDERRHTCFIATHSPYILTSFNNVILAGETAGESEYKAAKVTKLIPENQTLRYNEVAAFEIKNRHVRSIMDDEFRLISAEAIDSASQEISNDFDYLLKL